MGIFLSVVLGIVVTHSLTGPWPSPFDYLSCKKTYVDIESAKQREQAYFLLAKFSDCTYETEPSVLLKKLLQQRKSPCWKLTRSSPLLSSSSAHSGNINIIVAFRDLYSYLEYKKDLPEERKINIVEEFMKLLRRGEYGNEARAFIKRLLEKE